MSCHWMILPTLLASGFPSSLSHTYSLSYVFITLYLYIHHEKCTSLRTSFILLPSSHPPYQTRGVDWAKVNLGAIAHPKGRKEEKKVSLFLSLTPRFIFSLSSQQNELPTYSS
mmetsp:Transcript_28105/g.71652  ORF Transcript_28105/g.71652 Transcript_28105/m.71652 type:complete len:113 (+) Transcript_28105:1890-2228(+)